MYRGCGRFIKWVQKKILKSLVVFLFLTFGYYTGKVFINPLTYEGLVLFVKYLYGQTGIDLRIHL